MYTLLVMKTVKRIKSKLQIDKGYQMTPEFEKRLDKIEDDIKHGRNLSPSFETAEEMIKYLNSLK